MSPKKRKPNLTEREVAMYKHMKSIVLIEGRTFSYKDFEGFEVNDRHYAVPHGTCRNTFSKLVKMGLIELEYNSKVAFYTLQGHRFDKSST